MSKIRFMAGFRLCIKRILSPQLVILASLSLITINCFADASKTASIQIKTIGLDVLEGQIICSLFNQEDDFLKRDLATHTLKIDESGAPLCHFEQLIPGQYAVAIIHDQNSNDELDTNWIGLPKEAVGTSNNVKNRFGPPSYKDAVFRLVENEIKRLTIKVEHVF